MNWTSSRLSDRLRRVPADTTPTPTIESVSGSATLVITGTGFMAAAPRPDAGTSFVENVYIGTTLATSFVVDSATQITATVASMGGWNGSDSIVVNTSGGCAIGANVSQFTGQLSVLRRFPTYIVPGVP